ncbi:MAG TPA: 4Fe-4S dicluster domain-containing protein [Ktedonobacterales bacterium]|nr:4Fe-4S dicluster domain-containing protein [Ktedonobacterales bacterium]
MAVKRIFLDPSRCIGCRACVAACRECDTHKGDSMIYIDYIDRGNTVATSPTLCMHCEEPVAPCAQVCPAQAILISPDGVVHQADDTRCINIRNCVYACPFGVPKFDTSGHYMRKCNLCYDRTSLGKPPMCASVCPSGAIFYGTYEEFIASGRAQQGAKPINVFYFGKQRVRTRNYVVMTQQDDALDLLALAEEASLGNIPTLPVPTTGRETEEWVDADTAGIPQRSAPPQPWAPRTPPETPAPPAPTHDPGREVEPHGPERIPVP